MPLPITNFKNFLRDAGFTRQGGLGGWGSRRGYPVGFRFLGPDMRNDAVFSARLAPGAPTASRGAFAPPLDALIGKGAASVSIGQGFARLLLKSPKKLFSNGEVLPALDSFLSGLESGGALPQKTCGSCGSSNDLRLLSDGADAGLLCPDCLGKQASAYEDKHGYAPEALPKLLLVTSIVFLGVSLDWAAVAVGIDALFKAAGGSVNFSGKLMTVLAMFIGAAIALPALLFKTVSRRGKMLPIFLALAGATLGVALGEVLHADWILSLRTGHAVLLPPFAFVWRVATDGNSFLIFLRVAMAVAAIVTACTLAKTPKPKLAL